MIDKLKSTIEEITLGRIKAENIREYDRIINDLGLDSLDYAQVFFAMEEYLNIEPQDHDIDWAGISTVGQLADVLLGLK